MGNSLKINSINFEDIQESIVKNKIMINTLNKEKQMCLIEKTLSINDEIDVINKLISQGKYDETIIIYGENSCDNNIYDKYKQLLGLGFVNIYIYIGGLFEWLLLQDIYGHDVFPTTTNINDHLSYKGSKKINIRLLEN